MKRTVINYQIFPKNVCIIVSMVMCALSGFSQVNAEQVVRIGRNVLSMDDYMLSIQYFNLAIKAKPYLAEPYYYRGMAKLMLDDFKGAEEDCSQAIDRNKFITEAYRVRGFARARLGKDSLAIQDFDKGLEYNPVDKYFLFYKAVTQTSMKDMEGAETTFSMLIRIFPHFDGAYSERARLYMLKGDTVAALGDIEKASGLNKNDVNPYLFRASIEADRKEWTKAEADMDKAIELMPKEASFYVNRAYLRYNSDDYFGAMSDYNYAIELDPGNMAAVYNRALLRYEVRDLRRAESDLTVVLDKSPDNFHARYLRGLVRLENGKNRGAVEDFLEIVRVYPRFYPVYYGMAQAKQASGDMRSAAGYYQKGEELVRRYVKNPEKNPLDRPVIQSGETNTDGLSKKEDETEIDVMNRFNRLVTISSDEVTEGKISFNESIRGKVQDKNLKVETEPYYALSLLPPVSSLRSGSNYFRDLDVQNAGKYSVITVYLTNHPVLMSENDIKNQFSLLGSFEELINGGSKRPVDYFNRGVVNLSLKNYASAIVDFDKALEDKDDFSVALMGRANARYEQARSLLHSQEDVKADVIPASGQASALYSEAMEDLDKVLSLVPDMIYALFNKGCIYYELGDMTSALNCLSQAIAINPDFGEAYYNRGIVYLKMGNKTSGLADLSKAGELGVLPAYSLMKRMQ